MTKIMNNRITSYNVCYTKLLRVLYDYIPKEYFDRPKWGFSIPLKRWLYTDLSFLINEYLNEGVINEFNYIEFKEVQKLVRKFKSGHDYSYNFV